MAEIGKPRKSPLKGTKGQATEEVIENLPDEKKITVGERESDDYLPMNFKVPAAFRQEFKLYAFQHGMTMVELLKASFYEFRERNN